MDGVAASVAVFQPTDCTKSEPAIALPDELWLTVLESPCTFPSDVFSGIMLNLIKNPNITSSHLFRADIFYDSENDHALTGEVNSRPNGGLLKHLKAEYQPLRYELSGFDLIRAVVRQLMPRNPQLDRPLVQTCLFFNKLDGGEERNAVVYLPHVQQAQDLPFYHPEVSQLAFVHKWQHSSATAPARETGSGSISISYKLFPDTNLTTKLERTALRLLQTVHKHGQGQLAGYEKRVHLDQIIPQKRYQDRYIRLKAKNGKYLSEQWVEVTDPGKHVFEDLAIAAFLIELWKDMYRTPERAGLCQEGDPDDTTATPTTPFPGFIDIGCGNGVLVYILLEEGYEGRGFDARERKTWSIFPDYVQKRLQQHALVPDVFQDKSEAQTKGPWIGGALRPGTFIISNHADELTAWTPLLAYLNKSAFIAIPCCSHDLAGARFRAQATTKAAKQASARLPQQSAAYSAPDTKSQESGKSQAAETGSLKLTDAQKKMPSAYSTLCSYVTSLAEEVGYKPEKDVLRIPSTRNQCIVGRRSTEQAADDSSNDADVRREAVVEIVEREIGKSVEAVASDWIQRSEKLAKKPGSGH